MMGGMWSVAYTDIFQLGLVALGLLVGAALHPGRRRRLAQLDDVRRASRRRGVLPPFARTALWTRPAVVGWWDVAADADRSAAFPWNCYFQRVLSCRTPRDAQQHVDLAGLLTIAFMVPPLLIGHGGVPLSVARGPAPRGSRPLRPKRCR